MSERQAILGRIREALTLSAPVPGRHAGKPDHPISEVESARSISNWLPEVGESFEERIQLFTLNSTELKTDFHLLNTRSELIVKLQEIAKTEGWKKVGSHHADLTDAAVMGLGLPVCNTSVSYQATDLESCDAGISACDALIAQTGSVLVSSRSAGGRALSVLPPHHVVLATRSQLLADLPSAFAFLKSRYAPEYPSFFSFITGPSRTGDIERILVLGAHGPKKLTILCY